MSHLRCLSIRQPWAWLILHGGKDVENRSWSIRHDTRGTVLLHAAKGMTRGEYEDAIDFARDAQYAMGNPFVELPRNPEQLERGGIVGAARITQQWLPHESGKSPWHITGQFGFRLENITPLPFRQLKGALGFFLADTTPDEELALREAGLLPARVPQERR